MNMTPALCCSLEVQVLPVRDPYLYPLSLRCNGDRIPQLLSTLGPPAGYLPSWVSTAFLNLFPCIGLLYSSFSFHFHSFSSTAISTLVLFLPSLFTNSFFFIFLPFLCFLLFHIGFFSSPPVLLRHSSCPTLPRFSTDRLYAPSEFNCYSVTWYSCGRLSHMV